MSDVTNPVVTQLFDSYLKKAKDPQAAAILVLAHTLDDIDSKLGDLAMHVDDIKDATGEVREAASTLQRSLPPITSFMEEIAAAQQRR